MMVETTVDTMESQDQRSEFHTMFYCRLLDLLLPFEGNTDLNRLDSFEDMKMLSSNGLRARYGRDDTFNGTVALSSHPTTLIASNFFAKPRLFFKNFSIGFRLLRIRYQGLRLSSLTRLLSSLCRVWLPLVIILLSLLLQLHSVWTRAKPEVTIRGFVSDFLTGPKLFKELQYVVRKRGRSRTRKKVNASFAYKRIECATKDSTNCKHSVQGTESESDPESEFQSVVTSPSGHCNLNLQASDRSLGEYYMRKSRGSDPSESKLTEDCSEEASGAVGTSESVIRSRQHPRASEAKNPCLTTFSTATTQQAAFKAVTPGYLRITALPTSRKKKMSEANTQTASMLLRSEREFLAQTPVLILGTLCLLLFGSVPFFVTCVVRTAEHCELASLMLHLNSKFNSASDASESDCTPIKKLNSSDELLLPLISTDLMFVGHCVHFFVIGGCILLQVKILSLVSDGWG